MDKEDALVVFTIRDQSILLLFSPIFLSGNFFLTYHAQDFARSFNVLRKVKLYS